MFAYIHCELTVSLKNRLILVFIPVTWISLESVEWKFEVGRRLCVCGERTAVFAMCENGAAATRRPTQT